MAGDSRRTGPEETLRPRPAALRCRDLGSAAAREPAGPSLRLRHAVAAAGTKRLPRVVRHLARPDEIPERWQRLLRLEPRLRDQVEPEQGARPQRLAKPLVSLALGPLRPRHLSEHRRILAEIDGDAVETGA